MVMLRRVKSSFLRRRGKRDKSARSGSKISNEEKDLEAGQLRKKLLQRDALHGMLNGTEDEDDSEDFFDDEDSDEDFAEHELLSHQSSILKEKLLEINKDEARMINDKKNHCIHKLTQAKDITQFDYILEHLVDEDWITDSYSGDIYRMSAWGAFRVNKLKKMFKRRQWSDVLTKLAVNLGIFFIIVIQLIGAPGYFLTTVTGYGIDPEEKVDLVGFILNYNSTTTDVIKEELRTYSLVKVFAVCFMVVFLINALFVVLKEKEQWDKLNRVRFFLQHTGERLQVQMFWMYVGCFVNCWVVIWCSLDILLVCSSAKTFQDVLFDALSLLFLYNLDDIGGELGFFESEDWKGGELAWVYSRLDDYLRAYPDETGKVTWRLVRMKENLYANCMHYLTIAYVGIALITFPILHFCIPVITLTGIHAEDVKAEFAH